MLIGQLNADVTHANKNNSTPLYWAIRYGRSELIDLLIDKERRVFSIRRTCGLESPLVMTSLIIKIKK